MDDIQSKSYLHWMLESLGPFYTLAIPLSGLLVFVGGCVVVAVVKRPAVIAAYLAIVPFPLLLGIYGTVQALVSVSRVMAVTEPSISQLCVAGSTSLFSTLTGMLATFPSYLVVAIGLFVRMLTDGHDADRSVAIRATSD